ncbi:MAG: aldo/keto reductase [Acidiferrobacterales bacterium]|nr:aldo/keto reductase [Acidiferrobacterales bacterium]
MKILGNEIPPLGMGCWAIGGPMYAGDQSMGFADVNDATSIKTIHAALDAGVRIFDTAGVYGAGHSERLLGSAIKNKPDTLIISKLGVEFDEQTKQVLGNNADSSKVQSEINASLKRLQRDQVDIMLLHLNSLPLQEAGPIFEEMERARSSGKIRAYGWSTDFPASASAMADKEGFVGVEHVMSVFIDVPTMQSTIEENNLLAFIRSPLAMGILTGKFDQASRIVNEDVRATNSDRRDYFRDSKVAPKYLHNLDNVKELLRTGGRTLSQGSLCWLIAKSSRNIPLPGAKTVDQVQENCGALEFGPLPEAVMTEIETLIERDPEGEPRAR